MARGHAPAHLDRFLEGLDFPATQPALVEQARENGADQGLLETLRRLRKRDYASVADVTRALLEQEATG